MAERRMFTKKITDDENFITLSSSAQALYLHLSMCADDDGFSNQISLCMFKAHASVSDLEVLLRKRYIYQFDNGVIVIKHWRMANALRKDRYNPTVFQKELKKLSIKENGSYTFSEIKSEMGDKWLPDGCHEVDSWETQDRLGKDSIDNKDICSPSEDYPQQKNMSDEHQVVNYQAVIDKWNINIDKPKVKALNAKRKKQIINLINQYGLDTVLNTIDIVRDTPFLRGVNNRAWVADFDFFISPTKFLKIYEGAYQSSTKSNKFIPDNQNDYNFDEYEKSILSN